MRDFIAHGEVVPMRAARAVAALGRTALKPLLHALCTSADTRIQRWSLEALGLIGGEPALAAIRKATRDPAMSVRLHAIEALRHMNDRAGARELVRLLAYESGGIRGRAALALGELGNARCVPALVRALKDDKWYVRQQAAAALGQLRAKSARAALTRALNDPRKAVQKAAAEALASIGNKARPSR
ncbi:MAG: HEAT repeat domain-containing protein [Planctomycetes bacterium]|nr:HEAT repeat domain-containing protein [Planctomycetota bacterium]